MTQTNKQGKSTYVNSQRRRAERIIRASGCYSAEFRAEVQRALDTTPSSLPGLFRIADEISQQLETAGRSIRADLRKGGLPLGESEWGITGRNRPLNRSRKHTTLRLAEQIESFLVAHGKKELNEDAAERAETISGILYDISGETQITAEHPNLVRPYVLAIFDKLNELDQHNYETVQRAFAGIRDLLNGCSDARFDEIHREWNKHLYDDDAPKNEAEQSRIEAETPEAPELVTLRETLARLERVPENEATAFQLKSEIFRLEREVAIVSDWPDVIGIQGATNGN